jgi:hypothetical protein
MALHEREFFNERPETRPATFTCPHRDYLIRVDMPSHQSMVFL